MSTFPASVIPSGVPVAVQVISTVPDSSFCECPSSVTVNCCGGVDPLGASTAELPAPPPPPLPPTTCHLYAMCSELPDGSPDTENVTVPVGPGGQGPLYVLCVMLAVAETVTGTLDVEDGPPVPPDVLGPEVAGPVG